MLRSDYFLGEAKYRAIDLRPDHYVFPLTVGWLDTIYNQALADGRLPVLAIEWYQGHRMAFLPHADYCSLASYLGEPPVHHLMGRAHLLVWEDVIRYGWPIHFHIPSCDVPCKDWMGISWEQLCELVRDVESQQATQEPRPPSRTLSRRQDFPRRELRGGRGFQSGWRRR